ncbi:MAG TPA: SUMF1/EgtB/PvdO family nonheme iron enzyme [Chthoniobacteraceae bacterium]
MTTTEDNSSTPALPEFHEGQKLAGCYVLRRKVEAGADLIWLAYDEALGKDVSLHFLPPAVRSDARAMDELRQAIKRNRQLIHPNILRVYDFIEEAGWAAISMDWFEGESLAALRQKNPSGVFEPSALKPWLAQLCQTLEDAHKIQLIHRALSPATIFLDQQGRVLVANFGISRVVNEALARVRQPGTPEPGLAAMSPQQLDGERPTPADDIYSLGILFHELLAGSAPFTTGELVPQIRKTVPALLSARRSELKKGEEGIPGAWDKTVATCLEKSAEQRPKSMSEVASKLDLGKLSAATPAPIVVPAPAPVVAAAPPAKVTEQIKEPTKSEAPAEVGRIAPAPAPAPGEKSHVQLALEKKAAEKKAAAERAADGKPETESVPPKPEPKTPEKTAKSDKPLFAVVPVKKGSGKQPAFAEAAIPDDYPNLKPRRSGFPVAGLAAALVLIAIGIYGIFFYPSKKPAGADTLVAAGEQQHNPELTTVANPTTRPGSPDAGRSGDSESLQLPEDALPSGGEDAPDLARTEPELPKPGAPAATLTNSQPAPEVKLAANPARPAKPAPATPAPAPSTSAAPAAPLPVGSAPEASNDPGLAAKTAALERSRQGAAEAEKLHQDMLKQQQQAQAAAADAKKAFDAKTKAAAPMLKAAEELTAARKKREDEAKAADAAAQEAQKIAADKARAAEEAKKALADLEAQNKEKLTAQEKAAAELAELEKTMADRQREIDQASKSAAEVAAKRDQLLASIKQGEQEVSRAKQAAEEANRRAAQMEATRQARLKEQERIKTEMAEARRMFEERMKALERALEGGVAAPTEATAPTGAAPATPPAPALPVEAAPVPPPPTAPEAAAPVAQEEGTLAMKTDPTKTSATPVEEKVPAAAGGFENSLGMRFAPVGDVNFSVWQTRVKDFETFAKATGLKSSLWKDPGFKQGGDHPVVNVTWQEAMAFCKWLTIREQKDGQITKDQSYRLPTDLEWSRAVGLGEETGKTPEARDMGVADVYPWGNAWPPPAGAGNYTGEETGSDVAIKGYNDGFAWTSPVGSFEPNQFGLYDMGGNVWQWCMDSWNADQKAKVLRGASWYNGALKLSLLSSCRVHAAPDSSTDNYGFRIVLGKGESGKSPKR